MQKDPAVLFYTSDFLSGTFTMTNEQVGMYIRLLCVQHQKGKLSEQDMLSICPSRDISVWGKFDLEDGFYFNKRMYSEAEKRKNFTESRRKNLSKKKHMDDHMDTHMDSHMENGNENENIDENKNKVTFPFSSDFVQYWNQWKDYKSKEHKFRYRSVVSENLALKELYKISSGIEQNAIAIIDQSIINGWKGFFELKNQSNAKKPTRNSGAYELLEQLKRENGIN
jgi:hypothetical protein